ncbi:unnamed protein product [Calicophoron daubneyi]|uniref:Prolyl endopeptidase n=1 Tax=Calicophoron daubneyi TaxID=300641 RepID=A0AAV2SYK6_CALDB
MARHMTPSAVGNGEMVNVRNEGSLTLYLQIPPAERIVRHPELILRVYDPYRWLEDLHCQAIKAFISSQIEFTERFVSQCHYRPAIREKLEQLTKFDWFTCPRKYGSRYFWEERDPNDTENSICCAQGLCDPRRILLSPTVCHLRSGESILSYNVSPKGTYVCYEVFNRRKLQSTYSFLNCETGEPLSDSLTGLQQTSMAWTPDENGIFYTIYTDAQAYTELHGGQMKYQRLRLKYHRLGTSQNEDVTHHRWGGTLTNIFAEVSHCGHYLLISLFDQHRQKNKISYIKLEELGVSDETQLRPLIEKPIAHCEYITNEGNIFTILTDWNAPMRKIVQINMGDSNWSNWTDLIPHEPKSKLEHAVCVDEDKLIISRLKAAHSHLYVHNLRTGQMILEISLPIGRIQEISGHPVDAQFFVKFVSFTRPCDILSVILQDNSFETEIYRSSKIPGIDLTLFEEKQIFYKGRDGVEIPMFIVHKKDLPRQGQSPCKLTAFGGFGMVNAPYYSANNLLLMEFFDGLIAVANIRGGGEYGEDWHDAGKSRNKQNSFEDFIQAAEYLVQNNYTNSEKLFSVGRENGGLVAMVTSIQRPNLFAAVVAEDPLADMVRFCRYSSTARWLDEYGNPYRRLSFENLFSYSPLHQTQFSTAGRLTPAYLIVTNPKTATVEPIHSFKLCATLQHQAERTRSKPAMNLIRTSGLSELDMCADLWAFVQLVCGLQWKG